MKTITVIALALIMLASCSQKTETSRETTPPKKDIALQLYSLRDSIATDYFGIIKRVSDMGYTAVEAAWYEDGKFYGRTPEEFRADIEGVGMTVLSSHTTKQLSEKELQAKDFSESLKWWDECIAAHKAAGMKYIVAPWMDVPKTLNDLQTYCEYYNEIGKRCRENGMCFGYHNHAHEFRKVDGEVMLDYMLEHTNPEYVFFELDVYWTVRGQACPADYLKKYKNRFTLLHIKDDKELGQSGMVGFDAIFKNTDVAGVKHLIVEIENYNYEPEESVKMCLDYLLESPLVKESYTN